MSRSPLRIVVLAVAICAMPRLASPAVIDFETLSEFNADVVTNQFVDLLFGNAPVWTAGVSLNELDYPPNSGSNVILGLDAVTGSDLRIDFLAPVASFGGFFTYATAVQLQAFDSADGLLGSVVSAASENFASSLTPSPNEFLNLSFANMAYVLISGVYVLDDITYELGQVDTGGGGDPPTSVPEPGTLTLLVSGVALTLASRRRRPPQAAA